MTRNRCIWTAVLLLALVSPASALEVRSGQHARVESGEIVADDLLITGETVTIDGLVQGDVVAFGREIVVNGTIEGDLLGAGQTVVIDGAVLDDARIACMVLRVGGEVGDDLIGAGMSLETKAGSRVGGSLGFVGFQALLGGEVTEDASVGAQGIELRGRIGGTFEAEAGAAGEAPWIQNIPTPVPMPSVNGGLRLANSASVGGSLSYKAPQEASMATGARIAGETEADIQTLEPAAATPWQTFREWLRRFASLLLVGALLLWLAPSSTGRRAEELRTAPLKCLVAGLVGLPLAGTLFLVIVGVTILLAILFGMVGLGGLSGLTAVLGIATEVLLLAALFVGVLYFAQITVGIGVGGSLLGRLRESSSPFLALAAGLLLYSLLRLIPLVGFLVGLLAILFGFGAAARVTWSDWRRRGALERGEA